jgi:hypothetical protein
LLALPAYADIFIFGGTNMAKRMRKAGYLDPAKMMARRVAVLKAWSAASWRPLSWLERKVGATVDEMVRGDADLALAIALDLTSEELIESGPLPTFGVMAPATIGVVASKTLGLVTLPGSSDQNPPRDIPIIETRVFQPHDGLQEYAGRTLWTNPPKDWKGEYLVLRGNRGTVINASDLKPSDLPLAGIMPAQSA